MFKNISATKIDKAEKFTNIAANLSTVIAGLGAFIIYAITSYGNFQKQRAELFNGDWTTSPDFCVECQQVATLEFPFTLGISTSDTQIAGSIDLSAAIPEETPKAQSKKKKKYIKSIKDIDEDFQKEAASFTKKMDLLSMMFEGDMSFGHGDVTIFNYVGGRKVKYGSAKIYMKADHIYWQTTERSMSEIPLEAILYKHNEITEGSETTSCNENLNK